MNQDVKKMIIAVAVYSGASILGPMLFFGVIGFIIDKSFETSPKFLLIGIILAFIFSNILLFKKRRDFSKKISNEKFAFLKNNQKKREEIDN